MYVTCLLWSPEASGFFIEKTVEIVTNLINERAYRHHRQLNGPKGNFVDSRIVINDRVPRDQIFTLKRFGCCRYTSMIDLRIISLVMRVTRFKKFQGIVIFIFDINFIAFQ